VVIIDCGIIFANTQSFPHFVQIEWVKHMLVHLEDMCNFPHFTILSSSYLPIVNT